MKIRVNTGIAAQGVITTEQNSEPIAANNASENISTKKFNF